MSVSLNVDPFDTMYVPGKEDHYLLVGLSAIRCIEAVLENVSIAAGEIRSILDFPVGYGESAEISQGEVFPSPHQRRGTRRLCDGVLYPEFFDRTYKGNRRICRGSQHQAALI